jgi:hypothetical protein
MSECTRIVKRMKSAPVQLGAGASSWNCTRRQNDWCLWFHRDPHRRQDGVYGPRHLNDRLLLSMKATMSEMELSILRQRSLGTLVQKARHLELYLTLWFPPPFFSLKSFFARRLA